MAPTLALLLNKMECSGLEELGPTIAKKIHDQHWEVRDSALELLQSIAEMAKCSKLTFRLYLFFSIYRCIMLYFNFQNFQYFKLICYHQI